MTGVSLFQDFFAYRGRINRRCYFFRGLLLTALIKLLTAVPEAYGIVMPLPVTVLVWPSLAALAVLSYFQSMKRCHDVDKSGWFSLLLFIPLVNLFLGLYLLFQKGTSGPNRFGEDPLAAPAVE
jgi:uncharacterized membrane protein YhaH (DUF805 family)